MQDEYDALIENKTWELVPRPSNANILRSLWIFMHKKRSDGSFESPVVKPATIRTVLSIALSKSWGLHQLDVKNAFLHGNLDETVYMYQPLEFRNSQFPNHVCLLKKSLYGLKQAPWAWYKRFSDYVVQQVCLFMHDPRSQQMNALKRIIRYLKGTLDYGLYIYPSSLSKLISYTDSDWDGCPDTRRSTSGYCVYLGDNIISWSAERQPTLSRSSAEAEYRGVANVVSESCWIRNLLLELHFPLSSTTVVY
ncbi:transmembrane signal receptor [Lithospermum erythrorhizon]|uniref:Transmembrane signal receptor n=1 Tax=Lithospermum erythrorhizon TaxID=34254 RepID=A0AAV3Q115_LITER